MVTRLHGYGASAADLPLSAHFLFYFFIIFYFRDTRSAASSSAPAQEFSGMYKHSPLRSYSHRFLSAPLTCSARPLYRYLFLLVS